MENRSRARHFNNVKGGVREETRAQISGVQKNLARTNIWRAQISGVRTNYLVALAGAHLPRGHIDDFDAVGAARGDLVARGAEHHVAQRVAVVLRAELLATNLGELCRRERRSMGGRKR